MDDTVNPRPMPEYPQYLLLINGERRHASLKEASMHFNAGYDVKIAGEAMESNGSIRTITEEERKQIEGVA